jgi:hypothetical protein
MRQRRFPAPCRFPQTREKDPTWRQERLFEGRPLWGGQASDEQMQEAIGRLRLHSGKPPGPRSVLLHPVDAHRIHDNPADQQARLHAPLQTHGATHHSGVDRLANRRGKRCYARLRRSLRNRNSQIIMLILKGDLPSGAFVQREVGVCRPHRTAPLALAGESAANPDAALPRAGVFTVPPGARRFHDRRCARLGRRIGAARCGAR